MQTIQFNITNLTCSACVKLSIMVLEKIPGVTKASVNLATGLVELVADRDIAWDEITGTLKKVDKEATK